MKLIMKFILKVIYKVSTIYLGYSFDDMFITLHVLKQPSFILTTSFFFRMSERCIKVQLRKDSEVFLGIFELLCALVIAVSVSHNYNELHILIIYENYRCLPYIFEVGYEALYDTIHSREVRRPVDYIISPKINMSE